MLAEHGRRVLVLEREKFPLSYWRIPSAIHVRSLGAVGVDSEDAPLSFRQKVWRQFRAAGRQTIAASLAIVAW